MYAYTRRICDIYVCTQTRRRIREYMYAYTYYVDTYIHSSRGQNVFCQLGGFSVVVVTVALFLPPVCPEGGGMWGIFGKPLKRAIRNTQICMLY